MIPKFSIVLIARNEAKTLPRLVASLKEFQARGGEICLLDTGSTDNTAAIARELGCVVEEVGDRFRIKLGADTAQMINKKFLAEGEEPIIKDGDSLFDYASARNHAARMSSCDMIATPDCDEVWTKLDIDVINGAIRQGIQQLEYNFVFAHDEHGGEAIKFMHSKFYDRRILKWVGIVHEVLQQWTIEPKRAFFPEEVMKLEHWQNVETNRGGYLKGLAYDCILNLENDRNSHYFGRELFYTGRLRSAIRELDRHVAMGKWPAEASQSMIHIGEARLALGEKILAIEAFKEATRIEPKRREPHMKLAELYWREGNATLAAIYAQHALDAGQCNFYANYQPYYEHLPHEILYWGLWNIGNKEGAQEHFEKALAWQPNNPKFLHDARFFRRLPSVTFVIPTLGRSEGLERCVASIKALNYPMELLTTAIIEDSPRKGVPFRVKQAVAASKGEWLVYASNDVEFEPQSLILALLSVDKEKKLFVSFNTNSPGETIIRKCEHFAIHRSMVDRLGGEIFDTDFNHVGVDDLLWAKMEKWGHAHRCAEAIVRHYHFSRPGGKMDEVYEAGWRDDLVKKDRELLARKLADLNKES